MNPAEMRVVFMGSPGFAVPSLRALVHARYQVVQVVTQPDRPAGRGGRLTPPEVKVAALELGLPVSQPETLKDESVRMSLAAAAPDLFVVAAYGKILSRAVLAIPARGCINVHASLLPRWRGASPIAAAIAAGDDETGVSIMEMAVRMDAGPVIACERVPIGSADTTGSLEQSLAVVGAGLLVAALPEWHDGTRVAVPQDESQATYCSLVRKEDGWLRASMSVVEAERTVRACDPWPGAYVLYRGDRLAIWRSHPEPAAPAGSPGDLVVCGRNPALVLADGALVLDEVQRTGGRRLSGADFLNGERGRLEARVGLA